MAKAIGKYDIELAERLERIRHMLVQMRTVARF